MQLEWGVRMVPPIPNRPCASKIRQRASCAARPARPAPPPTRPACCRRTPRAVAAARPHAYVRCTRGTKLRQALAAILSQLQAAGGGSGGAAGAKRKRAAGYAAPSGSEATLIADLQAACGATVPGASPAAAAAGSGGADVAPSGDQLRVVGGGAGGGSHPGVTRQRLVILDDIHHLIMADDAAARPGDGAPVLRGLLQVRCCRCYCRRSCCCCFCCAARCLPLAKRSQLLPWTPSPSTTCAPRSTHPSAARAGGPRAVICAD